MTEEAKERMMEYKEIIKNNGGRKMTYEENAEQQMKEVMEWNGKPRWMWCWDENEKDKKKRYVLCFLTEKEMKECDTRYPVRTKINCYKHCAEIRATEHPLNNYELSQLMKCFGVEWKSRDTDFTSNDWSYISGTEKEIPKYDTLTIRYKCGEWEKPTRETVTKWWKEDCSNDIPRFISFMGWIEKDKE